jgi:dTDP-glucose 4,6-dehydratase
MTYAGNKENLKGIVENDTDMNTSKYTFVKGDITNKKLVKDLFEKYQFEFVIHFAAETHVDRSMFNFSEFIQTNVVGAHTIIEMCHQFKVKKLIFISTDEVYGDIEKGFTDENSKLNPSSPYSASKTSGDLIASTYIKMYNDPIIVVRSGNNYGTNQYPEKLIPLTVSNIMHNKKIPIHGTGNYYRSWVHVEDFCDAVVLLMVSGPKNGIYNVSGEELSNLDIVNEIFKNMKVMPNNYIEFVADRPVQDKRYAPDSTKLRKELNFVNKRKFSEEIQKIIAWYIDNGDHISKLVKARDSFEYFEHQSRGYNNWLKS